MVAARTDHVDAFVSYRRRDGAGLARWVRSKLRRYRLPPKVLANLPEDKKQLHARRPTIWLDTAYERPSDDFLTRKVYPALDRSARLIVISTPSAFEPIRMKDGADEPNWLVREIDRFLGENPMESSSRPVDLVLGPGGPEDRFPGRLADRLRWDWIDLRRFSRWRALGISEDLDAGLAKLVAGIYEVPDDLLPELWREERRRRNTLLAGIGLAAVTVALIVGILGAYAWKQRNEAQDEAERTRRQFHVVSMNLAQSALNEGSVSQARQLLETQRPSAQQKDLRDIDWNYLYQRATLEKAGYFLKDVAFESAALSPDGAWVAAGGRLWGVARKGLADPSHVVYVWSREDAALRHALKGHKSSVSAVAFSPTDSVLASVDDDQLIVWDLQTAQVKTTLPMFGASTLAFSPDGGLLAVANGAQVDLIETKTWTSRRVLSAYPDQNLRALAFSPDSRWLAVGGERGKVSLWNLSTGKTSFAFDAHKGRALSAAWSEGSNLLATGGEDGVAVWNMATRKQVTAWPLEDGAYSVAFAPDGRLLAIGSGNPVRLESGRSILLFDVPTRTVRGTLQGHPRRITSVAFAPSGQELISSGEEETVRAWGIGRALVHATLARSASPIWSLIFSAEGDRLAAGDGTGVIRVQPLTPNAGSALTLRGHSHRVVDLSFDPSGQTIASVSWDGSLRLWSAVKPGPSRVIHGTAKVEQAGQLLTATRFSPDGTRLAVATCSGEVMLWKSPSYEREPDLHFGGCLSFLAWSPDGQYIVAGGGDPANESTPYTVTIKRSDGSGSAKVLSGHAQWPTSAAFSPDGKRLATGGWDGEIILWDWEAGTVVRRIVGHIDMVTAVTFSPTGRSIVSASRDKTVRFWDAETGQGRTVLREHASELFSLAVHPRRAVIVAGGADGAVAMWQAEGAAAQTASIRR